MLIFLKKMYKPKNLNLYFSISFITFLVVLAAKKKNYITIFSLQRTHVPQQFHNLLTFQED